MKALYFQTPLCLWQHGCRNGHVLVCVNPLSSGSVLKTTGPREHIVRRGVFNGTLVSTLASNLVREEMLLAVLASDLITS
jgi:hypothetical protein